MTAKQTIKIITGKR